MFRLQWILSTQAAPYTCTWAHLDQPPELRCYCWFVVYANIATPTPDGICVYVRRWALPIYWLIVCVHNSTCRAAVLQWCGSSPAQMVRGPKYRLWLDLRQTSSGQHNTCTPLHRLKSLLRLSDANLCTKDSCIARSFSVEDGNTRNTEGRRLGWHDW